MRFGIAVREITPPFPTAMGGYGARQDLFDDVNDPLTFTAVVIEEGDRRALLGAADLVTFPNGWSWQSHDKGTTPGLLDRLAEAVQCPRDNVMLNASHTHGGPLLPGRSLYFSKLRNTGACKRYGEWLFDQVTAAAREAAGSMQKGTLWYAEGKTATPMNRRLERNGQIHNAPNPSGPVDDRMQLLVLRDAQGETAAVGMRMSCHPVATGAQHRITADYPGAWRAEFARAFGPRVTPFFLQGAGADARPRHVQEGDRWRAMKHSELPVIGRELLAETIAALTGGDLEEIADLRLVGKIVPIQAPCETLHPQREQLEAMKGRGGYEAMYAEECLSRLAAGKEIPDHVEYHVQTLWLNSETALIGLDVEPLNGLGRKVEAALAPRRTILLGYNNGCVSYAPDSVELKRGGYETSSYLFNPWSGPLLSGLEDLLAAALLKSPEV